MSEQEALLREACRALDDMLERYQSMGLTSIKSQAVARRLRAYLDPAESNPTKEPAE